MAEKEKKKVCVGCKMDEPECVCGDKDFAACVRDRDQRSISKLIAKLRALEK